MKSASRRQASIEDHDNSHERWLISYADFITLMFAFFVILYATSERDIEKTKGFQNAIEKYLIKAGAFGESGAKIDQGEKNYSVIESPIQTFRQNSADDTKMLETIQEKLEAQFTEAERKQYLIDLAPEDKGIRIVVAGGAIFSGETAKFSPGAMKFIDHLAEVIRDQKKPVMIEGHVGAGQHGAFTSTWDLAAARSVNMLRYFAKKYELPESQMAVTTFGASRPLNKTGDLSKNDRLELLVYYKDAEF
jgi:chemotaxis protein MotB